MVILGRNTLISENAVGTRQSILATLHAWSAQEAKLRGGVYRVFTVIEPRSNCPGLPARGLLSTAMSSELRA